MKRCVIGIVAHVDSGKTTLSEAMLYLSGAIRNIGRVDKGNAFLDNFEQERERGITIFSKQAVFTYGDTEFILLDTPGHADFSSETERTFSVLDYAVLLISGTDGVQSHTETLWKLLDRYNIPVFVFVNKTDISEYSREQLMSDIRRRLGSSCIVFDNNISSEDFYESISLCDEAVMNEYLETGAVCDDTIINAIRSRRIFPCCFGSALKLEGVNELLQLLSEFTSQGVYGSSFGARVFKIADDGSGNRLTYMKITGGTLRTKALLSYNGLEEKVNQIRIYSGAKFRTADEAPAGSVCAVTGLSSTFAGQGLGFEADASEAVLEPVLTYCAEPLDGTDKHTALGYFRKLEEEDPQLRVNWNERLKEIQISVMGEIQLEILTRIALDRFGMRVRFTHGGIAYRETISHKAEGVGHYEPLRHYAEVHLLLEPLPAGSGLVFEDNCREDLLDKNFRNLVMTHLAEKTHVGTLTGSPITDMKISLVSGKAHQKHTEGGDFRQAVYRAVRHGLRRAECVLLEPWYDFRLEIPAENIGRAVSDIQLMGGEISSPDTDGEAAVICGTAPVSEMREYRSSIIGYTKGRGRIFCTVKGYFPCHNAERVISEIGYDCDSDIDNTADSVFCAHGAGYVVNWQEVEQHMHLESCLSPERKPVTSASVRGGSASTDYDDKELMEIFERTYGAINRSEREKVRRVKESTCKPHTPKPFIPAGPEYLLVDGYNIIFAWDELKELSKQSLDAARSRLILRLSNYQGYKKCHLILVFDAYRVKGGVCKTEQQGNITVVYTAEAETADMYIEKTTHILAKDNKARVRVATSDNLEQMIILGSGAFRVSASEFLREVTAAEEAIGKFIDNTKLTGNNISISKEL